MVFRKLNRYIQENEPRPLPPQTRINLKWIKDFVVRPETIETLEENTSSKISDIAHSNIFLIYLLRQGK